MPIHNSKVRTILATCSVLSLLVPCRAYSPPLSARSVNALDKLHAKHALPGFTDRTAEEREIEAATAEITSVNTPLSFTPTVPQVC